MSLAQPITTVGMPAASSARAARLMLWWQTGQLAARMAASTPSALQRATTSGQSTSSVTRWLRLVGSPWKRGATEPMRPRAAARRSSGSGNQVPGSSAVVCLRSMPTWLMRRSWSLAVSPE